MHGAIVYWRTVFDMLSLSVSADSMANFLKNELC